MNLNQYLISKTPDQYDSCFLKPNCNFNSNKNNNKSNNQENENETSSLSSSSKKRCTCNHEPVLTNEPVKDNKISFITTTKYETLFCFLICFIFLKRLCFFLFIFVFFLIRVKRRFNYYQLLINSIQFSTRLNILLLARLKKFSLFNLKKSSRFKTYLLVVLILPTLFNLKSTSCLAQQQQQVALNSTSSVMNQDDETQGEQTLTDPIESINNQFKNYDCNEENEKDRLKFDYRLFYELNMHETIINLWKSCFRENLFDNDLDYDDNKEFLKIDNIQLMSCARQILIEKVLYKLLNNFHNVVDTNIFTRIQLVCQSDSINKDIEVNLFDKLYLLSSYEHNLCGNIFRNSMKTTHLYNDVLNLNQMKKFDSNYLNIPKLLNNSNSKNDKNKVVVSLKLKSNIKNVTQVETDNLEFKFHLNNDEITYVTTTTSTIKDNYLTLYDPLISAVKIKSKHDTTTTNKYSNIKTTLKELNNCTLILLNTYLLAYKTSCENRDFHLSLSHYDCASNNFSVKSNCKLCQVITKNDQFIRKKKNFKFFVL